MSTECTWDLIDVLSQDVHCDKQVIKNVVKLFEDDNTIPFIARYRQQQTSNIPVNKLREIKDKFEDLKDLRKSIANIIVKLEKQNKLDDHLKHSFLEARDEHTVEELYAPLKPSGKTTLANRARSLGLAPIAEEILKHKPINCSQLIVNFLDHSVDGLKTVSDIETGIKRIIVDLISKDPEVVSNLYNLYYKYDVKLLCSRSKINKENDKKFLEQLKKCENYFNFSSSIRNIFPHQTLAINRAEKFDIIKVKYDVPDFVKTNFYNFINAHYNLIYNVEKYTLNLITSSAEIAYTKFLTPHISKRIRKDLSSKAEKESLNVFADNLKSLLLTAPIHGKHILGIDPGFINGCKYALIAPNGDVLETGKEILHSRNHQDFAHDAILRLRDLMIKYLCEVIALGNGVGSRETEMLLSKEIKSQTFKPLNVSYCIVSEAGASVYSASDEAAKELSDMSVELRGAVSIARRLQDPLSELIKIDPKVIGVGMYQHDASESKLQQMADEVVMECVSFVGVDVNVASELLLQRVAGIGPILARNIINYREQNGPFINRQQLLQVQKIGTKKFEQCSGFLRILKTNNNSNINDEAQFQDNSQKKRKLDNKSYAKSSKKKTLYKPNLLDQTSVHPESYPIAQQIIEAAGLNVEDLGSYIFIQKLKCFLDKKDGVLLLKQLEEKNGNNKQITSSLLESLNHDLRDDYSKPLFKKGVMSIQDLKVNAILTGKVSNVTNFGAFVDIGVNKDGLLHNKKMPANILRGYKIKLNDCVEVMVVDVDIKSQKIDLKLINLLNK